MNNPQNSYIYFVRLPLIVSLLLLVLMGIFSRRGLLDLRRMVRQNQELQMRLDQATLQRLALQRQLEVFKTNPMEQERMVRQSLGYVRKNETVVEFD